MWKFLFIFISLIISIFSLKDVPILFAGNVLENPNNLEFSEQNNQRVIQSDVHSPPGTSNQNYGGVSSGSLVEQIASTAVQTNLISEPSGYLIDCLAVLNNLKRNTQIWRTPTITAFRGLYKLTSTNSISENSYTVDKNISKYLKIISLHFNNFHSPLKLQDLQTLMTGCSVNKEGHDFLMRFIAMGLSETLRSPLAFHFTHCRRLKDIKDRNGNNVLHLAVVSGNPDVVNDLLDALREPAEIMVKLLEEKNHENQTPLDLAHNSIDIRGNLKTHYYIYNFAYTSKVEKTPLDHRLPRQTNDRFCSNSFEQLRKSETHSLNSPTILAFRVLLDVVTNHSVNITTDKLISRSLSVINLHFRQLSNMSRIPSLQITIEKCSIDDKGHSLFMKFVRKGLIETLRNHIYYLMNDKDFFLNSVDVDGNNLIHLAVLSENTEVVNQILNRLFLTGSTVSQVLKLLEHENTAGLNPRNLAVKHRITDTVQTLNAFYQTLKTSEELD